MTGFRLTQLFFWLGLSIYFGGMVLIGPIVARRVFHTIRDSGVQVPSMNPSLDPPRQLAGQVFANILHDFAFVEIACLVLIVLPMLTQMVLYLSPADVWFWVRFVLVGLLVVVAVYNIFRLSPTIQNERQLWMQNVASNPQEAEVHQKKFDVLHNKSERNGKTRAVLLLVIVCVSAFGISYPTRRQLVREIAASAGLTVIPTTQPAAPGAPAEVKPSNPAPETPPAK